MNYKQFYNMKLSKITEHCDVPRMINVPFDYK